MATSTVITTATKANSAYKTTNAGMALGKAIFGSNQDIISPDQIATLLRAAGVPVPKGVIIAKDIAQIMMSGGAIIDGIEAGVDIWQNVGAVSNLTTAGLELFKICGLLSPDSPAAQVTSLGLDIYLVYQSGGENVGADISLCFDVIKGLFLQPDQRPQATAMLNAVLSKSANDWTKQRMINESTAAANLFSDYHNGKSSIFQMMVAVARQAPDVFSNYFPSLNAFIPPQVLQANFTSSVEADHGGVFGMFAKTDTITQTVTVDYKNYNYSDYQWANAFIQKYIVKPFEAYRVLGTLPRSQYSTYGFPKNARNIGVFDHNNPVYPRISILDLAALSLMPPYFDFFHDDFDIKKVLLALQLTPHDLGYDVMEVQLNQGYFATPGYSAPPGISINGVEQAPKGNVATQQYKNTLEARQIDAYDRSGNIKGLVKIARAERLITEFGIMPFYGKAETNALVDKSNPVFGYRNIRNFWGAIAVADSMRNDPFFKNYANCFRDVDTWLPSTALLEARHKNIQFLTVARRMNVMAKDTIAKYFNTTGDKIQLTPATQGKLTKVIGA